LQEGLQNIVIKDHVCLYQCYIP